MTTATTRTTWRRLKKNKGALIGITIIVLAIMIAVFAYLLAPDGSPNANRMIVEIGGQQPGYSRLFLQLPREKKIKPTPFFERLFYGAEDKYQYIPIQSYQATKDSLIIQKYIDEGIYERVALPLSQTRWQEGSASGAFKVTTKKFRLGSDKYGRDILSRLLVGVRVSLGVGLVTVLISLSIGVMLGALAGYFRGRTDDAIMWFINVIWSIPTLLLVFAITLVLGKGFWQVFVAIGLTMWVSVARIIRGQVLSVRELEYVEAAKALGFSHTRIILRHVLPNVMGPVMVVAASNFASAIVIEAGLSFLGVGVQPPQPSWGLMIKENYNFIITHNPMLALAPGFAIMLLVLAFNMLGNGLRDALQVKE
ncbi:peptide transporter [Niastella vici]|uniref:Peptide transporter n=1 Tax=Niastella vici TaxID=1703345 RepID=A0A1V9G9D5_9BACT|nr:ABC transporter permease [Niastella vici]OQP67144.1 peptide transporter [Niastella vici]